jgi:hypothetical protein
MPWFVAMTLLFLLKAMIIYRYCNQSGDKNRLPTDHPAEGDLSHPRHLHPWTKFRHVAMSSQKP